MSVSFNWIPEQKLLEKLTNLANQKGETLDNIVNEAVRIYVENQPIEHELKTDAPLIGLFKGSPKLATQSEDILQNEINLKSGWSWKIQQL